MPIGARGKVALGTALRIRGLAGFADAKHITTRDNADAHRTQAARINAMLLRASDTKRQVSAIRSLPGAPRQCCVLPDEWIGHRPRRPRVGARRREAVRFVDVFLSLDAFAVFLAAIFLVAPLRGAAFLARTLRTVFLVVERFLPTLALSPLPALRFGPATGFSLRMRLAARRPLLAPIFLLRRDGRPHSFATRLAAVFLRDLFFDRLSS